MFWQFSALVSTTCGSGTHSTGRTASTPTRLGSPLANSRRPPPTRGTPSTWPAVWISCLYFILLKKNNSSWVWHNSAIILSEFHSPDLLDRWLGLWQWPRVSIGRPVRPDGLRGSILQRLKIILTKIQDEKFTFFWKKTTFFSFQKSIFSTKKIEFWDQTFWRFSKKCLTGYFFCLPALKSMQLAQFLIFFQNSGSYVKLRTRTIHFRP